MEGYLSNKVSLKIRIYPNDVLVARFVFDVEGRDAFVSHQIFRRICTD